MVNSRHNLKLSGVFSTMNEYLCVNCRSVFLIDSTTGRPIPDSSPTSMVFDEGCEWADLEVVHES